MARSYHHVSFFRCRLLLCWWLKCPRFRVEIKTKRINCRRGFILSYARFICSPCFRDSRFVFIITCTTLFPMQVDEKFIETRVYASMSIVKKKKWYASCDFVSNFLYLDKDLDKEFSNGCSFYLLSKEIEIIFVLLAHFRDTHFISLSIKSSKSYFYYNHIV